MTRMRKRLILDGVLGVLLIFEMFYSLTGNLLHEIVGILFFVTVGIHLWLTRQWTKTMGRFLKQRKTLNPMNIARMVIAVLLAICGLVLLASSVMTSHLLGMTGLDLAGRTYATWSFIHTLSAYGLCIVVLGHLAIHWVSVVKALRIPYNPQRRQAINAAATGVVAIGAVALGVVGAQALGLNGRGQHASAVPNGNGTSPQSKDPGQGNNRRNGQGFGPKGQRNGKGNGYGNGSGNGSGSGNGKGNENRNGNGGSQGNGSNGYDSAPRADSSEGTSTEGTCPLCRERCPLSSPRCQKPFNAGIIA